MEECETCDGSRIVNKYSTWEGSCPDCKSPDTPKLWRDMSDEEKGALLLAYHEGKVIEYGYWAGDYCRVKPDDGEWFDEYSYRVKPEPVRETVEFTDKHISFSAIKGHRITFDLIDGKPDPASIKMEEL